jgi:hypothetical protein
LNNNLAVFCKLQQLLQFDHVNNIPSSTSSTSSSMMMMMMMMM